MILSLTIIHLLFFAAAGPAYSQTGLDPDFIGNCRSRIQAGEADSAQTYAEKILKNRAPDRTDASLAALFFDSGHYRHAVYWLRRIATVTPDESIRQALDAALRNAGIQAYENKRYSEAADLFQEILVRFPNDSALARAAAGALYQAGRIDESLEVLRDGVRNHPKDRALFQMATAVFIENRGLDDFASFLEGLIQEFPGHEEGRIALSRLRASQGRREESLEILREGLDSIGWNERWAGGLAQLHHAYGQYSSERNVYLDWMKRKSSADTLILNVAGTYESEQNWPKARSLYRQYGEEHKHPLDFEMGETFRQEGKSDSALIQYQAHLRNQPGHLDSWIRGGEVAEKLGSLDLALEYYSRWSVLQPESIEPWMSRGRVLERQGRFEEAKESYLNAEGLGEKAASAYALYRIHGCLQNEEEKRIYRNLALIRGFAEMGLLETEMQNRLKAYQNSMNLTATGSERALHDSLRSMIKDVSDDWIREDPLSLEKVLLEQLQKYEDAPMLLDGLADVYVRIGRPEMARAFYEKAVERNPRDVKTLAKLAELYSTLGEKDLALRVFRSAVELSPHEEALMKRCIQAAEAADRLQVLAERWEQLIAVHPDYRRMKENTIALWHRLGRNDKVLTLKEKNAVQDKRP